MTVAEHPVDRREIYYWKCDRPAAFHGTLAGAPPAELEQPLKCALSAAFPARPIALRAAGGQGNHRTYLAQIGDEPAFIRVEDGPEQDDYLEVESHILGEVSRRDIPAPRVLGFDATRTLVPFAWQALERIPFPDLNEHHKRGRLRMSVVAGEIGSAVARWQAIAPAGFGPFRTVAVREEQTLAGFHERYEDYFLLQLDRHLTFLVERAFLRVPEARELHRLILAHRELLALERGCLVHKDLALWNMLGTETQIVSYIDWDDAISGDPMDDLSLLGCFYDGSVVGLALTGYAQERALPGEYRRRFWLHLLRNMIVKAVIRVGAGYFRRDANFFLIGAAGTGADLERFTRARLGAAARGLCENLPVETL
jgi:aminoglycoside phosphotransferase (APT) family kinase protein